jgi:predicted DNA-binding protein
MLKSGKKVKELSVLLSEENSLRISEAIGLLRDDEPFEGAISLLSSFYDKSEDNLIRKAIEGFMNDLKDQSVCKEIIKEIRKPFKQATISMLVSSCWQSGLDYSEYSADMAEVFLRSDYVTALECLTVIEDSVHELSLAKRNEIINIILGSPLQPSDEKAGLTHELLLILKQK